MVVEDDDKVEKTLATLGAGVSVRRPKEYGVYLQAVGRTVFPGCRRDTGLASTNSKQPITFPETRPNAFELDVLGR
ncbi:hypothetical protein D3C85_1243920 [compost metagenome]